MVDSNSGPLHSEHATGTRSTTLPRCSLTLHLLADLNVDLKEFGDTSVEADGFAFVQVAFAVVLWNALFEAGVCETIEHISNHLKFCFSGCDLLGRCGALDPAETEHGHREEFEGMVNGKVRRVVGLGRG